MPAFSDSRVPPGWRAARLAARLGHGREPLIGLPAAANDNPPAWAHFPLRPGRRAAPDPAILPAALRFFAVHQLAAARQAGALARKAARHGDMTGAEYWNTLCRALDPSLARSAGL